MCGACLPHFYEWGGVCMQCDGVNVLIVLGLLFAALLYCVLFHRLSRNVRPETKIFLYFVQMILLFVGENHDWVSWMGVLDFEVVNQVGSTCVAPVSPMSRAFFGAALPFVIMVELGLGFSAHCLYWLVRHKLHGTQVKINRSQYLRTALGLFIFSYNSVSKVV